MKRDTVGVDKSLWTLAKGTYDGRPLLIRFRQRDASFRKDVFPERLNLFWSMSRPDDNGLASEAETAVLRIFEDDLVARVEGERVAVLAVVLTCNGMREFVFQVSDVGGFLDSLNAMPQGSEPFPIRIEKYTDPGWTYVESVISRVGQDRD